MWHVLYQESTNIRYHCKKFHHHGVLSCADLVGNVSWTSFPEGRSSELGLRRRVGQAAHTLINPQV